MGDSQYILTLLQTSQLFMDMDRDELVSLIEQSERKTISQEEILLAPGQQNRHIYLILSGRLRIHLDPTLSIPLTMFGPGECVGEISILDNANVSAYVIADSSSELLAIPDRAVWSLIGREPGIARNLLLIMSQRMRLNDRLLLNDIEQQQQYECFANTDELTGLHNRRWMNENFQRQIKRCMRNGESSVLIMLDVDYFKRYNDNYGHVCGDQVLRLLGKTLPGYLRTQDMAARYGGEEFAILLPQSSLDDATAVAERLRLQVCNMPIVMLDGSELPHITISLGIGASSPDDSSLEQLVARADAALYRAKQGGRNRVSA